MKPRWYQHQPDARFPYVVTEPRFYLLPHGFSNTYTVFRRNPRDSRQLARLKPSGCLTVFPGYAFDGATGGPDLPQLMEAVLLHDVLCQCEPHKDWPIRRAEADRMFLLHARITAPVIGAIYYGMIRALGSTHRAIFPPDPDRIPTIVLS
jgi:hypothetical protein